MPRGVKNVPQSSAPAADASPDESEVGEPQVLADVRDEIAMRIAAAIVSGVVNRGGLSALAMSGTPESLMKTAYEFADSAMRVRAAP